VAGARKRPRRGVRAVPWHAYARGAIPVVVAAGLAALVRGKVDIADVAMLFLVAIATSAAFLGRGPSVLASVLAVAVFDFFFVPPYLTFDVAEFRHVLTFGVMLCAGILISGLTERIRRQSSEARERERRTAALYALTRALAGARDVKAIAAVASAHVLDVFQVRAALRICDERVSVDAGEAAPGVRVIEMPLLAEGRAVGVLAVRTDETRFADSEQRHLLATFVAQIALALERAQLADEAQRAQLRAQTEEMRSSLLSSVSHDLRTPIGSMLGTATTLLDSGAALSDEQRTELVSSMRDEAARLARLVANLIDMTRVESGALEVKKEWVPLEELVGAVMHRFESRLEGRDIVIDLPPNVLAPIDPVLFEQVLVNLLENAIKHTPAGSPIEIRALESRGEVHVEVADRGPGLPAGAEARIFDKFVRAGSVTDGVGLGLAICKGIVDAHGGKISAGNRAGGGASFRIVLPVEGEPPLAPAEPELERELGGGQA